MNPNDIPTGATFQLPPGLSTVARDSDDMYYVIFWCSVVLFFAIVGPMFYFVWKYHRKPGDKLEPTSHGGSTVEYMIIGATVIFLAYLFHAGFKGYVSMAVAPPNAIDVRVYGSKWNWAFEYPNGSQPQPASVLVVPVHRPVRLVMSSEDVIHSFYVPDFRVKKDVVPGMYSTLWFEANTLTHRYEGNELVALPGYEDFAARVEGNGPQPANVLSPELDSTGPRRAGGIHVTCTEYCGDSHSMMRAVIRVVSDEDYQRYLTTVDNPPMGPDGPISMAAWGEQLFNQVGCTTCHKFEGTPDPEVPELRGVFGHEVELEGGTSIVADEAYLRESIVSPQARIVRGYTRKSMSLIRLTDRRVDAIVAYLATLGNAQPGTGSQ